MTSEEVQADREFKKLVYDLVKRVDKLEGKEEPAAEEEKPEAKEVVLSPDISPTPPADDDQSGAAN